MMKMLLSAGALAAALGTGVAGAWAADLDYGPRDRYSYYDEEPRYAEPPPPPQVAVPVPRAYVYRDGPRYRDHSVGYGGCLPRHEIKARLLSEGWRDFHDLEVRDAVAKVRARRPSGELYDLKVDRCSGDVVKSVLLQGGGYGPYAYGGPRRFERTY